MTLILIFIMFISVSGYSQNLVPNPSFEDENICERGDHCNPSAWFDVRHQPHGYKFDNTPGATGNRWINVITGSRRNSTRQYWKTLLLQPMTKGKRYKIVMSVSGWDNNNPYPKDIGILFTDSMMPVPADTIIYAKEYLVFTDAKYKDLKNGWFRMEKEYVATSDHRGIVLGNFSTEDYVATAASRYSRMGYIGLKVDDLQILPYEKQKCEKCKSIKDSLYAITRRHYPVPKTDTLTQIVSPVQRETLPARKDSISLGDILFDSGNYRLKNSDILDQYEKIFSDSLISRILVSGYTDNIGSLEDNISLSAKRAEEVSKLIQRRFKINPSVIQTEGKGISETFKEQEKNRRVDIFIYY